VNETVYDLYEAIDQIDRTMRALLLLVRQVETNGASQFDAARCQQFNLELQELRAKAAMIASQVQLRLWLAGVDRRNPFSKTLKGPERRKL